MILLGLDEVNNILKGLLTLLSLSGVFELLNQITGHPSIHQLSQGIISSEFEVVSPRLDDAIKFLFVIFNSVGTLLQ